jgi:hypothetical protein
MIYQDFLDLQALKRYATAMNSRAKHCGAKGTLTSELLRDRIFESGGQCEWCAKNLVNRSFELDHVLSLSQRGTNLPENLVVSCESCNRRKSNKHPARFAAEIYNETGQLTSLLHWVFTEFKVIPTTQRTLFDEDSANGSTKIDPDESSPRPPYKWS